MLALPPPYTPLALREGGDAFDRAMAEARAGAGAGLLVWVRRFDTAECAVILEPEETLAEAWQVIFAGAVAVADALSAISPPEKPLTLSPPDRILFDGGLVGGVRLGWPEACAADAVPAFVVFGFALRVELRDDEQGLASLVSEGFDDFATAPFLESFARHFMQVLDVWSNDGPQAVLARWRSYGGTVPQGDLAALRTPSWCVDGEIAA